MNARTLCVIALSMCAVAMTGCLERRIRITSEPSGALVHLNDVEVGRTPLEVDFTYYGTYDVRIRKEGFEPLTTQAKAEAPLYELPIIDLVAEALPTRIVTNIDWHFELKPAETDVDEILARARQMRQEVGGDFVPTPPPVSGEGIVIESDDEELPEDKPDLPSLVPTPDDG